MKSLKRMLSATLCTSMLSAVNAVVYAETENETTSETEFEYVLSPENYAIVGMTENIGSAISSYHKFPLSAYVNTVYSGGNAGIHTQLATIVSEYKLPLKNAATNVAVTYEMAKGNYADGRFVPVYYDLEAIPVDTSAGTYSSADETTSSKYNKWFEYLSEYWPASGYNSTGNWATAYEIGYLASDGVYDFDITSTALAALQEDDSTTLTLATGRANNAYLNYKFKLYQDSQVPVLTVTYSIDAILEYVNSADADDMVNVINALGVGGVLDETEKGYTAFKSLSGVAQSEVANKLFAKVQTAQFTTLDELRTAYDESMELNMLEVVKSPTDYALAILSTLGYHTAPTALAYINATQPSDSGRLTEYASVLSSYYLPFKDAVSDMKITYSLRKGGYKSGYYVPVFYDLDKFPLDVFPGTYEAETEEYASLKEYANEYWAPDSANYTYTPSGNWPIAVKIESLDAEDSSYYNYTYDVSSTALSALKASESENITFATGRENTGYLNYAIKLHSEDDIPKLTIKYTESDIIQKINTTDSASMPELLSDLNGTGLMGDKGYSYTKMKDASKSIVEAEIYEDIANGGFNSFDEFMASYTSAVNTAMGEIKDNPDLYINFDDTFPKQVTGDVRYVESFNGTKALRIDNEFGKEASQYANIGEYNFGEDNFSIVFWMKAPDNGINGAGTKQEAGTEVDFTNGTATGGGVVLSNTDYSVPGNTGLSMIAMCNTVDFALSAKFGENDTIYADAIQYPVDSRWHQISYVVDRQGNAVLYVDDTAVSTTDIRNTSGSLNPDTVSDLILGADGLGQFGMNKGEFDEFKIYSQAMAASEIAEMYYRDSLKKTNNDIASFLESDKADDYTESLIAEITDKLTASESYLASYEWGNSVDLKTKLDELNNYFDVVPNLNPNIKGVALFASDIHYGSSTEANEKFVKSMTEYKDLGFNLSSYVSGGDNSERGVKYQHTFFNALDETLLGTDINVVVTRGNHDDDDTAYCTAKRLLDDGTYIEMTAEELREEFEKRMNPYVDSTLEANAGLYDESGVLDTPYYYSTDGLAHYVVVDFYDPQSKLTDAQLAWIDSTLAQINGDGKPIFIIQHIPILNTVLFPDPDFGMNAATSEKLDAMLKKYDNIIVLCGHYHRGFGTTAAGPFFVDNSYYLHSVPSLGKGNSNGYPLSGAYYMLISDDKVTFRARDFVNQMWMRDYDFTVSLKSVAKTEMQAIELTDSSTGEKYDSLAEASGKTVNITVPVSFADGSESAEATAAMYNGDVLSSVSTEAKLTEDSIVFENITVTSDVTEIKVFLWNSLNGMNPLCEKVTLEKN